jgi:hypothetical protein
VSIPNTLASPSHPTTHRRVLMGDDVLNPQGVHRNKDDPNELIRGQRSVFSGARISTSFTPQDSRYNHKHYSDERGVGWVSSQLSPRLCSRRHPTDRYIRRHHSQWHRSSGIPCLLGETITPNLVSFEHDVGGCRRRPTHCAQASPTPLTPRRLTPTK